MVQHGFEGKDLVDDYQASFHGWSTSYDEFESGPGHYPVAIVEKPDGQVAVVQARLIRFLDKSSGFTHRL
jgi:hypothetical protein